MSDDLPPPSPPDLPDPPKTSYQRPKPIEDPAERFLKSRGIGAEDAGKMGKAMGAGTALMGSLVGGVVLGWIVDRYLIHSATPWGLIVGFAVGTILGFTNLIRLSNELNK